MCDRQKTRKDDPFWVYRGFLRALNDKQLRAHEKWQIERSSVGSLEEVADARVRLDVVADEFSRRGRS